MSIAQDIADAAGRLDAALAAHPERRMDMVELSVLRGEPRPYPAIYLWRGPDTDAGEVMERRGVPPRQTPEEWLRDALRGMTGPLGRHNPIQPRLGLGRGTGTIPASFGIFLDPELGYTPVGSRALDDVLAEGLPDPEASGIIPEMREHIDAARSLAPEWVQISLPDMQGPFNIAHAILGDDAFLVPLTEPDKFRELMAIITEFFIQLHANLMRWIGPDRLPAFPAAVHRIAECSVNMISEAMYLEHVLPHDLRIADYYGEVAVHPCSGPHVFYATMRNLPHVVYHEAGYIEQTAAGAISVDDALAEVGGRPIILSIGQELPPGREEEFIRRDLDRAADNPRLLFSYTSMYWKKADEPDILDMHLRLDEYWETHVLPGVAC